MDSNSVKVQLISVEMHFKTALFVGTVCNVFAQSWKVFQNCWYMAEQCWNALQKHSKLVRKWAK